MPKAVRAGARPKDSSSGTPRESAGPGEASSWTKLGFPLPQSQAFTFPENRGTLPSPSAHPSYLPA